LGSDRLLREYRRPWKKENDLHIEQQENQGDDIETVIELDAGGSFRFFAALVRAEFARGRIIFGQQIADPVGDHDKKCPQDQEYSDLSEFRKLVNSGFH